MFDPKYRITGKIAKALMSIEADRQIIAILPLTVPMLDSLRRTARLLSTHFSTQIEGNQLSPSQVKAVVEGEGNFPGRERDEAEVRHYFAALQRCHGSHEDARCALDVGARGAAAEGEAQRARSLGCGDAHRTEHARHHARVGVTCGAGRGRDV